jgi:hypothetical protein
VETKTKVDKRVPLRAADQVMRLNRLGSFHQCRLSFMRILTRRMVKEKWAFTRPVFDINANGVGHAVYSAHTPYRSYSLVVFAHDIPDADRSDRVIAHAWDSTFTLFDGIPTSDDIERLRKNIPLQEAGRVTEKELSVSRANRSVRLWEHVVSCLADGIQPEITEITKVGYLMRTTAVYGSGKLGAADREMISGRPECAAPFQIEMLSVFLTRTYVRDLVQHMAKIRGKTKAVELDSNIARCMGIGNSTGLGMAPFLLNHPNLLNNWIMARETAISRVRNLRSASISEKNIFCDLLERSILSAKRWQSDHPYQLTKLMELRRDLHILASYVKNFDFYRDFPWDKIFLWSEVTLSQEAQECLASLILEPYGYLVDPLAENMSDVDTDAFRINGSMTIARLRQILEQHYGWALNIDWTKQDNCARAWYVSAEKAEPRLGERFEEPIAAYEQPLAPGRDAAALFVALDGSVGSDTIAKFLLRYPEHRHTVRRAQIVEKAPYAEIQDNTIGSDLLPIDMLRCKLAFFGATHFDPRSDRWVRICLFGNAPYPEDLQFSGMDDWSYPPLAISDT